MKLPVSFSSTWKLKDAERMKRLFLALSEFLRFSLCHNQEFKERNLPFTFVIDSVFSKHSWYPYSLLFYLFNDSWKLGSPKALP